MPRAELQTARLKLRPVAPQDEAAVIGWLNDIEVSGWLAVVPFPYRAADFHQFQQDYATPGETYAVEDATGFVGILGIEDRTLGYWFAPKAQGLGYATEAARGALAEHFASSPEPIASGYFEGNARSAKVLRKLGFVETGRDVKFCRARNAERPHVCMSLTRQAFLAAMPLKSATVLKTRRLTLRPLAEGDRATVVAGIGNLAVAGWLSTVPHPYAEADFDYFLTEVAVPGETFVVEDAAGVCGVVGAEGGELGYWFATGVHGRGYATEAARAVLAARFAQGAETYVAGYFEGNARSANVLRKLGFVEVGRSLRPCRALGCERPHVDLVLTRAAFVAALPIEAVSPRLTYRSRQATDLDALHDLVSRPAVLRNLGPAWPWPADRAFSLTRSTPYLGHGFAWGVFRDGIHIGSVAVTEGELGYVIHPDHAGQGFASEAIERCLTRAFDEDGLDEVHAGVWADNAASIHLLRKFGFTVTGEDMGTNALRPEPSPGFTLRLTRADWLARALIRTPRLAMRPMTRADAPLFHDLVTRPDVARNLYLFHPDWTLEEAGRFLDDWAWRGTLRFRLALIHDGQWAGWIGVSDDAEPEIFYALRPEFAGKGLAREAVAAFSAFLFDRFDPPALTAGVFTDNPASARVLQACGFARVREDLHVSKGRLAPAPCWVYRLANPGKAATT